MSNFFAEQIFSDIIIGRKCQTLHKNTYADDIDSPLSLECNQGSKKMAKVIIKKIEKYLNKDLIDQINEPIEDDLYTHPVVSSAFNEEIRVVNRTFRSKKQKENKGKKIKKRVKTFVEREGDWTCFECQNLNFSFRKKCNRCHTRKSNSDQKHDECIDNVLKIIEDNEIKRNKINNKLNEFYY